MRRTATLLAWGALSSTASAWAKFPWDSSAAEESWTPPVETGVPRPEVEQDQLEMGFSPRPTEAPELYGRMLYERMDGYSLGTDTCGFNMAGNSFTCITAGASCSYSSGFIGCCGPTEACTIVKTTCIDYAASAAGSCNLPDDRHTLCCGTSMRGACFTWLLSTTGSGGKPDSTFTLLDCSQSSGTSTLLDYDPAWAKTHSFPPTSTTASTTSSRPTTTTTSAAPQPTESSKTNVGAIAGGAVGGVAGIALIALAVWFILRKKRNNKTPTPVAQPVVAQVQTTPPDQGKPPVAQTPSIAQSPQSFAPVSPMGSAYPSGVPPGYVPPQSPQPYDPNMNAYNQQPGYGYPAQSQYQQYPPQQGFEQQGYQQQQQGYQQQSQYPSQYGNVAGFQPPSSTSPPPNMTPSPAPKENETAGGYNQHQQQPQQHQQQQQQQQHHNAQELPAINPIGNESNRAELG